ncbi:hypothetical protein N1851_031564 [Merluccius polli]|uniref:Uncharacterized protein n=1 Tax=Merluccius polli TaxID=89951 RepID=A0AA47M3P5_MERPO|nr:hypothetical protein N1851_031564 [Merluccius polli]
MPPDPDAEEGEAFKGGEPAVEKPTGDSLQAFDERLEKENIRGHFSLYAVRWFQRFSFPCFADEEDAIEDIDMSYQAPIESDLEDIDSSTNSSQGRGDSSQQFSRNGTDMAAVSVSGQRTNQVDSEEGDKTTMDLIVMDTRSPTPAELPPLAGLSSAPGPSPAQQPSSTPETSSTPGPSCDAVSFWKNCNKAGNTQAIFSHFIAQIKSIASKIQTGQASHEECDIALQVMEVSGHLTKLVEVKEELLHSPVYASPFTEYSVLLKFGAFMPRTPWVTGAGLVCLGDLGSR